MDTMNKFTLMTMILSLTVAACGTSDPPLSCQDAIQHYYGPAQCDFTDLDTGLVIPENTFIARCQAAAETASDRCQPALDEFLQCLDSVDPQDPQCNCSSAQMAFLTCH